MTRDSWTDIATRLRAPRVRNSHGVDAPDWSQARRVRLTGLRIQALSATEQDGRAGVTHRLFGPRLDDLLGTDRVEYTDPRGTKRVYELVGDPIWHRGTSGRLEHIEAELKAMDI